MLLRQQLCLEIIIIVQPSEKRNCSLRLAFPAGPDVSPRRNLEDKCQTERHHFLAFWIKLNISHRLTTIYGCSAAKKAML